MDPEDDLFPGDQEPAGEQLSFEKLAQRDWAGVVKLANQR